MARQVQEPGGGEPSATAVTAVTAGEAEPLHPERPVSSLTLGQLVREITGQVSMLGRKQIELAKTELRSDIKAELGMIARFGVAAVAAFVALNMLFVAAILALALVMPAWAAGLLVSAVLLAVAGLAALLGWRRRVRRLLEHTRHTLKDDVRWSKEQIA
jgi:uncharacterized membrane protein YqjE